jgi:hypothetical protein
MPNAPHAQACQRRSGTGADAKHREEGTNEQVSDCGRNRQVDALQSNQLPLVSVASLPNATHQDVAMLKGLQFRNSHSVRPPLRPQPRRQISFAVNELAMSITDNFTVAGESIGKGGLNIPKANGEELHTLAPNRIESGFCY